jgi:hypothetical protein
MSAMWPPLDDPVQFESLCLDLWADIWGPGSTAQKNGRSGQPQAGVDVFGCRGGEWIGIQCKQKSGLLHSKVTEAELNEEVENALGFDPQLGLFILATTGPRDAKLQKRARAISVRHAKRGKFRIEVWSWQDIWHELEGRPELRRRFGRKYWPEIFDASGEQRVASSRLPHTTDQLFGRETELAALSTAWADPKTHVVTLVAWGGVGKTSLVAQWAAGLAARDYDGAGYFDWSFYSQGTKEEGSASGEPFVNEALRFFGGEEGERIAASPRAARDKGAALAGFVAKSRTLLILDGMEPLQYPPGSPLAGELKDPGVAALLKGLAGRNSGLCVVTTRESVTDLAAFRASTAPEWKLERLSLAAGLALLEKLQVKGNKKELETLVEEVAGHALTLNILGSYLRDAHEGDVRKLDLVELEEADREERDGHAFRAIATYEKWLGGEKEAGARQLAILSPENSSEGMTKGAKPG